jgi:hypothetical protein
VDGTAVVVAVMARRRRLRQVTASLLAALIAAGVVLVGAGGLEGNPNLFATGAWLVTLAVIGRLLLSRDPPL